MVVQFVAQLNTTRRRAGPDVVPTPYGRGGHLAILGPAVNRVRSALRDADANQKEHATPPARRTLNKRWAQLIHRIYDVDLLVCTQCGDTMKVLAFITQPGVIRAVLEHRETPLARQRAPPTREPTSVH